MTEQQIHLTQLIKQQNEISQELQSITNLATSKRELLLKVQGAIEYLQQIGVVLSEPQTEAEAEAETQDQ
jgi:hypothetical protein